MGSLLFLAVLPVAVLCYFVYLKDRNREPIGLLLKVFFLGFFSAIPVVIVELFLGKFFPTDDLTSVVQVFINVFISVALVEEGFKWLVTKFIAYHNKEFDEVYDIIVYAVFASLGFACIENILYVMSGGLSTAILRAVLSIPGHACFGVLMGYFFSQAKLANVNENKSLQTKNLVLSILIPTAVHTIYDALLFSVSIVGDYVALLLILLFLVFVIAVVVICCILVSKVSKMQQSISNNVKEGSIVADSEGHINYEGTVTKEINFCPVCGQEARGFNYCRSCGFKLK